MSNEMMQKNEEVLKNEASTVSVIQGFASLESFEFSLRAANLLSKSSLVPKEYQANIPNCVIALNMANRMGADPLMVMQNLYIVHGRPGWSSQFLISTFNTSGKFSALRYEWVGTPGKDDYGCKAWAIEKSTGEKLEGSAVTIDMAKKEGWYSKNGSKWQTMPQQMLMYRAASWFVRAYAPELAMGMHTAEELHDISDPSEKNVAMDVAKEINNNANKEVIDVECEDIEKENLSDNSQSQNTEQIKMEVRGPGF
ncbi:hypothetical protein [Anaerosolibacter sp.]|uniref:hypothetical protein n=1 Tax=Anaerosolibacter sp. TaxID=1872527 RepID=UPI0039F1246F